MSRLYSFLSFFYSHRSVAFILFSLVYICFLDTNSVWKRHYRWQAKAQLEEEIAHLRTDYEKNTRELEELRQNARQVERVARERYYMTRPGEDLFIIQSDLSQPEGQVVYQSAEEDAPEV